MPHPYYIWSSHKSSFKLLFNDLDTDKIQVLDPHISYKGLLADCADDFTMQWHLEDTKKQLCQHYLVPGQICEDRNLYPCCVAVHISSTTFQGHLKKSIFLCDINIDPKFLRMSWRSSGSYIWRTLRVAILFNSGQGAARNFQTSPVLLRTYWQFQTSLSLSNQSSS